MTPVLPTTIPQIFAATVACASAQPALGTINQGQLSWRTWAEIDADVQKLACTLSSAGVGPGQPVAQISENRYEWILADLAILSLGAVHVPMHMTLSVKQIIAQLADCRAEVLFLSDKAPTGIAKQLAPELKIIGFDSRHASQEAGSAATNYLGPQPHDLATILYTSGTTGRPRGVMLTHNNLVSNAIATAEAVGSTSDETRLCFLPLSHIYARTCDLTTWLNRGTRLVLAESRETIVRDCQIAQPTVINGVPYFYQKIAEHIQAADQVDQPGAIHELLGSRIKRCFCGGAAVAPEVEALFESQSLPLLSGYGLTEASPVVSASSRENTTPGTVGRPLFNLEVKIADGEILVRGPSVMRGYWQDEPATQEALADGWLRTGDLGEFEADGNLRIVGRKKEIIVLSTGKNVSPTIVEQRLTGSPLIEYACVMGDGQKCLAALIVPNPDAIKSAIRRQRLWVWSRRRAVTHPRIRELYRKEIDRLLGGSSREEQIGPFEILDRAFCVECGELTPKLSLCRAQIVKNFSARIERMVGQHLRVV